MKALYRVYYALVWVFVRLFYRIRVTGRSNLTQGALLVCGNHTSLFDPIAIAYGMGRHHPSKFFAKAELAKIPVLKQLIDPLIIFVRRGKSDMDALRRSIAHLQSGGKLVVFPEGTRGGDGEAKTGVIMMAVKGRAPVLPVFVTRGKKGPRWRRIDVVFGEAYDLVREDGLPTNEFYRREADELMRRINALEPKL